LPRGVTVAQATLDRFVMVRIHARQPSENGPLSHLMRDSNFPTGTEKRIR
jgi:hypothetical protein